MSVQINEFVSLTYEKVVCANCTTNFYISSDLQARRQSDGREFYCPMGHTNVYIESDRAKLEKARAELARAQSQLHLERDQRLAAELSRDKLKRRIAKGVCPCCKRTVRQLARHMADKHPDFPKST